MYIPLCSAPLCVAGGVRKVEAEPEDAEEAQPEDRRRRAQERRRPSLQV
jgi:hypothetical protein